MKQLRCLDLAPGDILLKMATSSLTHKIIQFGQRLVGQPNPFLAHAAVALDTEFAIEAQSVGVTANHLRMKNKDCGYYVYRCNRLDLARGAATAAKLLLDIQHARSTLKYDTVGAGMSLFGSGGSPKSSSEFDALLVKMLDGRGHLFFCSQFVVFVYHFAALQRGVLPQSLFPMSDTKVSPSALASMLQHNSFFREEGYMMPNER